MIPKSASSSHPTPDPVAHGVLTALLYADIFRYPLSLQDLLERSSVADLSAIALHETVQQLVKQGYIYQYGDFYSTVLDADLAERRLKGNALAIKKMKQAHRIGRLIMLAPYVRCVTISGSLSKDYMEKGSDLDFFLITKPGRLWMVKALMVFIKKVILLNSHRHFCVNYLIDEAHLEIEEKNIFTATEVITLRPVAGATLFRKFIKTNPWSESWYPNYHCRPTDDIPDHQPGLRRFLEVLLNNRLGDWLERKAMHIFERRIANRYKDKLSKEDLRIAFKSSEHVSKYHEKNFQRKVRDRFRQKVKEFEEKHQLNLSI